MDEMNKIPEEQKNAEPKKQDAPAPQSAEVSAPVANIPTPKAPIPKLPLIIGPRKHTGIPVYGDTARTAAFLSCTSSTSVC